MKRLKYTLIVSIFIINLSANDVNNVKVSGKIISIPTPKSMTLVTNPKAIQLVKQLVQGQYLLAFVREDDPTFNSEYIIINSNKSIYNINQSNFNGLKNKFETQYNSMMKQVMKSTNNKFKNTQELVDVNMVGSIPIKFISTGYSGFTIIALNTYNKNNIITKEVSASNVLMIHNELLFINIHKIYKNKDDFQRLEDMASNFIDKIVRVNK